MGDDRGHFAMIAIVGGQKGRHHVAREKQEDPGLLADERVRKNLVKVGTARMLRRPGAASRLRAVGSRRRCKTVRY